MIITARYKYKFRVCILIFFLGVFVIPGYCYQTGPKIKIVNNISGDPNIQFSVVIQNLPLRLFYGEEKPEIAEYRINFTHWQTLPAVSQRWQTGSGDNYDFVMDGQAYVDSAENTIEIRVKFIGENLIVKEDRLFYALPSVKFRSNNLWIKKGVCLSTSRDTILLFQVGPAFDPENVSNNKIKSVFYTVNGSKPIPLSTETTSIIRVLEIEFTANSSLHKGHNLIEMWAQGDCSEYPEYSDTVEVDLVILDFDQFPDNATNTSPIFSLYATPKGGWYSGMGIIGITPWFDPAKAGVGVHSIMYTIPIGGKNYSIEKDIEVSAFSTFNIDGDINVCSNSIHLYEITPNDPEADHSWTVEGAQETTIAGNKCWITWGASGSGKILVDIKPINKPAFSIRKLTYINCKQALDPPELFWGDNSFQLLVCSEDKAKQYTWHKNEQEIESTFINHVFLNSIQQGTENDLFYVEIESLDGCITQSNSIDCSKSFLSKDLPTDRNKFNIHTAFDPLAYTIVIEILENIEGPINIEVLDIFSRRVIQKALKANSADHIIERIEATGLSSGIYIISVSSNEQNIFRSELYIY